MPSTIEELIAQTDDYYRDPEQYMSRVYLESIRAILEQVKLMEQMGVKKQVGLEAIREFVTRVGAKYTVEHPTVVVPEFMQPWWDELAAMEKNGQ